MMAGAILVQNTAWSGAKQAVDALKLAGLLSPSAIRTADPAALGAVIRPAGYFNLKTRRLKSLCEFLGRYDDDLARLFAQPKEILRAELLGVWGVGKETADSIVCYEAKQPLFVVDAYTRRLFHRLGWTDAKAGYDTLQDLVHGALPADADLFGQFHALIVHHAKAHCRSKPACPGCPLAARCRLAQGESL
ncbi:putative DNA-3-methyladenine glycosylase III [Magnetofaba australis IT-1]|uniref:Putative DNA-3-methyladenine glycosylase III n=2 Tax=Magnetofaba TaxID=1472292 RepID=A0A1Y2K5M2_9PROT|nr:putative DNA-3-methyladenine glycosylase III [Magnetofaba australis IT-1]